MALSALMARSGTNPMSPCVVKICDPDGHRDRDEAYGIFDTSDRAAQWAADNIPRHITWHVHDVRTLELFDRAVWEAREPDFLTVFRHTRDAPKP
jgi:hypothetical protein